MSSAKPKVRKKKRWGKVVEFTALVRDLNPSDDVRNNIVKEASRSRAITAQAIAQKYNVRVSTAKKILEELVEEGKLQLVTSSPRVKVYGKA